MRGKGSSGNFFFFNHGEIPNAHELAEVGEEEVELGRFNILQDGLTREGIHDCILSFFHDPIITGVGGYCKHHSEFICNPKCLSIHNLWPFGPPPNGISYRILA